MVYNVPCECGKTYIGETGRTLEARLKEHKYAVSWADTNNGIAVHANEHNHKILWEHTKIVEKEPFWMKREIKEALNIKRTSAGMNLDGGYQYLHTWDSVIT